MKPFAGVDYRIQRRRRVRRAFYRLFCYRHLTALHLQTTFQIIEYLDLFLYASAGDKGWSRRRLLVQVDQKCFAGSGQLEVGDLIQVTDWAFSVCSKQYVHVGQGQGRGEDTGQSFVRY